MLLARILEDFVRRKPIRKLAQRIVVTRSEAPLDEVTLLVRILVQDYTQNVSVKIVGGILTLRQIRQFIVLNSVVNWQVVLTCGLLLAVDVLQVSARLTILLVEAWRRLVTIVVRGGRPLYCCHIEPL